MSNIRECHCCRFALWGNLMLKTLRCHLNFYYLFLVLVWETQFSKHCWTTCWLFYCCIFCSRLFNVHRNFCCFCYYRNASSIFCYQFLFCLKLSLKGINGSNKDVISLWSVVLGSVEGRLGLIPRFTFIDAVGVCCPHVPAVFTRLHCNPSWQYALIVQGLSSSMEQNA